MRLDHVLGDGERARALLPAVLHVDDPHVREFRERRAAAAHALENRHDRDAVEDRDFAAAADRLREVVARHRARVEILRADERVDRAVRVRVHRDDDGARLLRRHDGRLDARRIGRVHEQDVDLLLQHVLDVAHLLAHVVMRVGDDHLRADRRGRLVERLLHRHEVRVVQLLERHADLQRRRVRGARRAERERKRGGAQRAGGPAAGRRRRQGGVHHGRLRFLGMRAPRAPRERHAGRRVLGWIARERGPAQPDSRASAGARASPRARAAGTIAGAPAMPAPRSAAASDASRLASFSA
ncbi:hypothetical protein Y046_3885 [Burkholderia pseudomallei MSHR2990]|nr:hypothetical protein Y046_3885 [Burkholderia pseudomallei MSHR2990]